MNLKFVLPANMQESMARGRLDFDSDTFTAFLMRDGFIFRRDRMIAKKNFEVVVDFATAIDGFTINAISDDTESATLRHTESESFYFSNAGFVVGSYLSTTHPSHTGVYVIRTLAARTLTLDWVSGDKFTAVTNSKTSVFCVDEMETGNDYIRYTGIPVTFSMVGGNPVLGEIELSTSGPFGAEFANSQGMIICADTSPYSIAAYAEFDPWTIDVNKY